MAALRKAPARAERLVVGLGNPGAQYAHTRHNIGFLVLDVLARRHRLPKPERAFEGRYAAGEVGGATIALLAPHTFMNESGRSVAAALRGLGLGLPDLLVVHDHIDLAFGRIRVAHNGGTGGHNGLKSLRELVGTDYDRVRVGVDRPPSTNPDIVADYVLSPFGEPDEQVRALIEQAADAVEVWLSDGLQAAAARFNS